MKEPSPLVPQGSFEAMARGKSHVRIAFYTIVAVHLLVIGGLLILGCKRDDKEKDLVGEVPPATNDLAATPPFGSDPAVVTPPPTPAPSAPSDTNLVPPPPIGSTPPPVPSLSTTSSALIPPLPPIEEPAPKTADTSEPAAREHVIVKGDTFGSLASRNGVTVKALQAANPGVDATRLRIGQKVKIPAKSPANGNGSATPAASSLSNGYVVKSGDNLGKIASANGTTVRELQRLNNLSTTQIRVGQKLRLPPRSAPTPGGAGVPAPVQ